MAKRKNSTALFEVMRDAQRKTLERQGIKVQGADPAPSRAEANPPPKPAKSYAPPAGHTQFKPLATPAIVTMTKRWFNALMEKKARPEAIEEEESPALDSNDPTAGMTAQSLASRNGRSNSQSHAVEAAKPPARTPAPVSASRDVYEDEIEAPPVEPVPEPTSQVPAMAGAAKNTNEVAIDRDKQQVTVKVRFNTVIIGAVAVLSVVGLAYIVGKKAGTSAGQAVRAPSTTEIRSGDVTPGVLNPGGAPARPLANNDTSNAIPADSTVPGESGVANISPAPMNGEIHATAPGSIHDTPIIDGAARRMNGLNYCVIESYSHDQQEWALRVRDYLNGAGIPCTIEIGRPNLRTSSGDYIIVGTRGFSRGFGELPAYKQYEKDIAKAAAAFPDKTIFNIPQTMMVKWIEE